MYFYWQLIFYFILGSVLGSFLAVCIYRLPRNISIVTPGSFCHNCRARLKAVDLLPILSYLFLKGKCSYCKKPIPLITLVLEFLTGFIYVLLFLFVKPPFLYIYLFLMSLLIIITFIDYKFYLIPDRILLIGLGGFFILNAYYGFIPWRSALEGGVLGTGIFILLFIISKGGMGVGDIKLIGLLGLYFGWQHILLIIFIASFLASLYSLYLILYKKKSKKDLIPFGPFLSLGAFLTALYGGIIIQWYLNLL